MATYVRQSSFSDGDTITAALFNNEFNQLVNAFNVATGHTHDGSTAGDGGPISNLFSNALVFGTNTDNDVVITFNANSNDGVLTWMEDEDYFQFSDDLLLTTTEKLQFRDTAIYINSSTDGQLDIVADTEIQIAATTIDMNGNADISGNLGVGGNLTVTGTTTFNGGTITMGDAATDNVVFGADVDSNIIPDDDDSYDLGSSTQEWRNLYIDGTANIDSLVADTADINGGTIDAANITVGSGKTLDVSAGTLTLADNQISGDKVEGGTINATTINTLTYGSITDGTITVTAFVDEDNMASNSATLIPTQQSVKAYVDAQDTAQDLDLVSDSGTIAIDLDGETLTVTGGEGIDTSASSNTLTITGEDATTSNKGIASFNSDDFNVSSGAVTLATTSTAAELNLLDGTTAGTIVASKGVAVDANKDITGFRNITLTGELDAGSLDISGNVDIDGTLETDALSINGTTVTATAADINLIDGITNGTVIASKAIITDANKDITGGRNITISGELDAATLDISGNADIDGTLEADAITIAGVTLAETISDTVGAMVTSNTESGITVAYDDSDNTLDFTIGTLNQNTTGSAATLTTARTIGGVSFDGSANINLPGVNAAGNQDTTGNAATATLATTTTVTDSTANTNFPVVFHNESNGLLDDTGALRYNPSTGELLVPKLTVAGTTTQVDTVTMEASNAIIFEGATADAHETTLSVIDPTADRTISLPNATGTLSLITGTETLTNKTLTAPTLTGTTVVASLDISGDIDVDGTTNLDVVDIDGAVDMATTLAVGTSVTVGSGNTSVVLGKFDSNNSDISALTSSSDFGGLVEGGTNGSLVLGIRDNDVSDGLYILSGSGNYMTDTTYDKVVLKASANGIIDITDNLNIGGVLDVNGTTNLDVVDIDGAVDMATTLSVTGEVTLGSHLNMGDGDVLKLGTDADLQIYHDNNNGLITNTTGNLYIQDSNGTIHIQGKSGEESITAAADGAVTLYHNNNPKLATTSTGIDVTGTVTATGTSVFASLDISGDIDVDGTTNLDVVDIDGAVNMATSLAVTGAVATNTITVNGASSGDEGGEIVFAGAGSSETFNLDNYAGIFRIFDGSSPAVRLTLDTSGNAVFAGSVAANSITLADDKELIFGSSSDFKIFHSGNVNTIKTNSDLPLHFLDAGGSQMMSFTPNGGLVINESSEDFDFRVESNANTHMLFVDGGNDRVGIGTSYNANYDASLQVVANNTHNFDDFTSNLVLLDDAGAQGGSGGHLLFAGNDGSSSRGFCKIIGGKANSTSGNYAGQLAFKVRANGEGTLREAFRINTSESVFNETSQDTDFRVESNGNAHMLFVDGGNDQVLIGKNSDSQNTAGTAISTTLGVRATVDANTAAIFNRTSDDGNVLLLRKDGTTVGQMAAKDGDVTIGTGDTGFRFIDGSDAITPHDISNNTGRNAAVDLGTSGAQFKDLYLSGEANIGSVVNITSNTPKITFIESDQSNKQYQVGSFGAAFAIYDESNSQYRYTLTSDGNHIFNEGSQDCDFRVESNGNTHMLFVDGGNDKVGIGNSSPSEALTVTGAICQNTGQPTASNGQFVHFNTGSRTVSSSTTSTVTLLTRSPNSEVSSTGTCYLAAENSGGSIQFGVIIDFFYSNGTLQTTARETGSSQGTTTVSIAESGNDLAISVAYGGGLGGAIKYTAAGHAVNASY